ncbi:mechanosensitive ion channel [Flavobacteriaceae bacterium TP-CH-4]|uniref:Mechanosensitive ion channel n=1 Tax=Pelagihabitans pacificus TaxID=2696054 RepID=A0A967AUJ8_9FLAO|nr:mechanosensitive ion channel domain-containing protein [Pelagihabitans pacificus]NHF59630.1 mechanosensitive ion channel [Pelagihabitans pacificus]
MEMFISNLFEDMPWLAYLLVPGASILLGLAVRWILFAIFKLYNSKKPSVLKEELLTHLKAPTFWFLPLLFTYLTLPYIGLDSFWHKLLEMLIIVNLAWLFITALGALEEAVKHTFNVDGVHQAKERKVLTQLRFMKSIAQVVIATIALASILWNIPTAKQLGETILTSAGVLGIIVGVAAQKSIANLITGFQIAFTQTLKIDDEVVIEGEFGTVEDITLTYVVVRTWDWRRLVLPLNYFNDKSFVNWSFASRRLIGSVYLYVDYTFPVAELREKFLKLLKNHRLWDKKEADLLVTDSDSRAMQLRATFSAKNATDVWNLRCDIREQLISFIRENHPNALPKIRMVDLQAV